MTHRAPEGNEVTIRMTIHESNKECAEYIDTLCDKGWQLEDRLLEPRCSGLGSPIRVADLFCGCGGFTLGMIEALESAGRSVEIALAADADADAQEVYLRNFAKWFSNPNEPNFIEGPIEEYFEKRDLEDLPSAEERAEFELNHGTIDILVGGPPCQGHSNLNNSTRGRDERNTLYYQMLHVARLAQPKLVLIENVASAINSKENVVENTKRALESMDYHVELLDVWGHHIGLAQKRRRLVLVGHRMKQWELVQWRRVLDSNTQEHNVIDVIDDLRDEPENHDGDNVFRKPPNITKTSEERIAWLFDNDAYDLCSTKRPKCQQGKHRYKSMYGRMKPDEPAQTITTGFGSMGQGRFVHPHEPRLITPHEAARIQGFPDAFDFRTTKGASLNRTALQRLIGNAVPPRISAFIVAWFHHWGALDIEEASFKTHTTHQFTSIEHVEERSIYVGFNHDEVEVSVST